jgi:general stress protein 26
MKEFIAIATEIIRRADMLCLGTRGKEEYPSLRALFNLRNPERFPSLVPYFVDKGLTVYLGTNSSSAKLSQIAARPWVSVYYMVPDDFKGLMLAGRAVPDPEARKAIWIDGWERYYPLGRDDPDYQVLRIEPIRARGWFEGRAFDVDL